MFPVSKRKPFHGAPPRELEAGEVTLEDASLDLSAWGSSLSNLATALESAGYALDDDLVSCLAAYLQFIENAGLSLDTVGTDYDNLQTWLAAFFAALEEDLPVDLETVATSYEHLVMALRTLATGYLDLAAPMSLYAQELTDHPTVLHAAGYYRSDLTAWLSAASSTVFVTLATYLAATDGSTLTNLGLRLLTRRRTPSFQSLVAQRVSSIATEVSS